MRPERCQMKAWTHTECRRVLTPGGMGILVAVLFLASVQPAHAYVDPNSVGPLYQFLFPLFIAIASALTALRRQLARLWARVVDTVAAVVRRERMPPPDRH